MKHFTLLEIGADADSPMIGTINNIPNTIYGTADFKTRFIEAVGEHFDLEDFSFDEIPDLFTGSPYEDIMIEAEGMSHEIRILETWMY